MYRRDVHRFLGLKVFVTRADSVIRKAECYLPIRTKAANVIGEMRIHEFYQVWNHDQLQAHHVRDRRDSFVSSCATLPANFVVISSILFRNASSRANRLFQNSFNRLNFAISVKLET